LCGVVLGLVGKWIAASPKLTTLGAALVGAGAFCGSVLAALAPGGQLIAAGGLLGIVVAILCFPACAAVLLAARASNGVRPDTIAAAAARRRVLAATAGGVAVASLYSATLLAHARSASSDTAPLLFGALGIATLGGALVADLFSARALRRLVRREMRDARVADGSEYDVTGARVVDLGVGEVERVVLAPRKTAYRDTPSVATVFRGAPEDAMDVVKASILAETFALALALLMLATAVAARTAG
jgi:hypothetical protein